MRARFACLLSLSVAAFLSIDGGDANAVVIRYGFVGGSGSYTGGTVDVGSLDQPLSAGPVAFTVEVDASAYSFVANYLSASSTEILYSTAGCGGLCFNKWNPSGFNFGSIASNTTWRSLLGTFNGANSGSGDFSWSTISPQLAGTMAPPPSSITFSAAEVPGPLPALGAAAAFGWSRRLRKRISSSGRSPAPVDGPDV